MAYIGNKPANKAVVASDLDPAVITGQTALAVAPADTDEFLISDAGTLKRLDASLIGGGKVLKIDNQINNTRTAISNASSKTTMLSGTYTNNTASSKMIITIKMPMHGSRAGAMGIGFTWNSTDYDGALSYTYEDTDNLTHAIMNKGFDNPASTGSISWVVYFKSANSASTSPCVVLNPNSTEDARLPQQETQITFMEYST